MLAPPPPTPPTIIGESVVITQNYNGKHKKVGKPVISGYVITFSTAMNQGSLGSIASYVVDTVTITKRTEAQAGRDGLYADRV